MNPKLSICCITYNHEKYIEEALNSFLMQEADFPFEILVHDDASTDNTAKIIKQYEKKYPDKIKAIYQVDNQYSKGKKVIFECLFPHVKGEYIAFCEGDDFWNDKRKLQKQFDFLVDNIDYSACFHGVKIVTTENHSIGRCLGPLGKGSKEYTMKNNIRGGFIHISSLVIRSRIVSSGVPEWAIKSKHGDYALSLIASANGKVHFIDEVMSSHRVGVENSLMTKLRDNYSKENEISYHKWRIQTLEEADEYYKRKFHEDITDVIYDSEIKIFLLNSTYRNIVSKKYKHYFRNKGVIGTLKLILLTKKPNIARTLALYLGELRSRFNRMN